MEHSLQSLFYLNGEQNLAPNMSAVKACHSLMDRMRYACFLSCKFLRSHSGSLSTYLLLG